MLIKILYCTLALFLFLPASAKSQKPSLSVEKITESKDKSMLSKVIAMDISASDEGHIQLYIADFSNRSVLIMGKDEDDLKYVDRIGREGLGPGEFIELTSLQIIPDGKLMVYDRSLARATFFDSKTKDVEHTFDVHPKQTVHFPMAFYADGKEETIFYARGEKFFSDTDDPTLQRTINLQKFDKNGDLLKDSVLIKSSNDAFVFRRGGNMSVSEQPIWGNKSIFRFNNDLIYYTWTGNSEIEVYNREGLQTHTIPLQLNRLQITEDDRERALTQEADLMGEKKRVIRSAYFTKMPNDYWPWLHDFHLDDKGRFWLAMPNHLKDETRLWRIQTAEGEIISEVYLPANLTVFQIKNNIIAGELFDYRKFNSIVQLYQITEN